MSKSNFVQGIAEIQRRRKQYALIFGQINCDAAMLALHEVFGFGGIRMKRFHTAWMRYSDQIMRMLNEDAKDDPDAVYAKHKIDEQLKDILLPEDFRKWEDRYGRIIR